MEPNLLYSNVLPSPIASNEEKDSKEYAYKLASGIYTTSIQGATSYYYQRNAKFLDNRIFANGKQPFQAYLDLMGVQGKESFLNLDYHPRPIAPKFRDILVNTIMEKIERVECTGLSLQMNKKKEEKKNSAAFRMDHKDFIQGLQQEAGVQFEKPDDFTPDSDEELNLWAELNDKEHEELLMEEGINFILYNNDWESIKREISGDLVDNALACSQNYFDGCNRIRVRRVKPEYLVYGSTQTLDFRNVPYVGHMERMSIVDVRSLWPDIPEKKLYELASNWRAKYGNPNSLSDYNVDYQTSYTRPYDGFLIDVLFYEYRVTKYVSIVKGEDKNGRPILDYSNKQIDTENKKSYRKPLPTIYAGAWLIGSDIIPQWGEMPNLLRSNLDIEDVRFSYSIFMLNNDGTMIPKSPIDNMKSSIIQMDLAILKIQHTLATAAPDGVRMDIDAVTEIDLGQGIGKVGPMKLREIRLQTGDEYYSGKNMDGSNARPPMENAIHNLGDKLQQFMGVYNWELNNIRDYIGVNEIRDGSAVPDRLGLQVMNNQIQASNTATAHIYNGFIKIMTNTAKCIGMRLWDTLKQSDANSMYLRLLGQKNVDFIKKRTDITDSNYDVMVRVNMNMEDVNTLEKNIDFCLQNGTIELQDAVVVRDYAKTNPKKAILYLAFVQKKRKKAAMEEQMAINNNAQAQQGQLVAQQQQQKVQDQQGLNQQELAKVSQKGASDIKTLQQKLINDALLIQMENGKPLPRYVEALITEQAEDALEQEQAEAMQEQMAQMQQEQQQQGDGQMAPEEQGEPQEQMPEEQMM